MPTLGTRVRGLVAGAPAEAIVLAAAVPPLFLHATYQPHVSIGLGSTTVDLTLADAAVAAVLAAALVRARREGWEPLRRSKLLLTAAAALAMLALLGLATPSLLGEEYDLAPHAVSALKFGWYALLLAGDAAARPQRGRCRTAVPRDRCAGAPSRPAWGLLQFLGLVAEFEGKRPGQREPSFLGIHDFAALSGAALVLGLVELALGDGRPLGGRRWPLVGARRGRTRRRPLRRADSRRRALARARRPAPADAARNPSRAGRRCRRARRHRRHGDDAGGGDRALRRVRGLRDRVEDTGVQSYAHRTLLAYIGARIWLDHPIAGIGWQASNEPWASAPYLDDARRRFPDEPAEAFPSPEHRWGVQTLYVQVLADLGVIGFAALADALRRRSRRAASGAPAALPCRSSAWRGCSSPPASGSASGSCRASRSRHSPGSRSGWRRPC